MNIFINYPKCSTCKNAKKWLDENGIKYSERNIVENNPTEDELKEFLKLSGQPVKKFFNTSGILYREMNLKEKVASESEEELLKILATNGMLVKRPLLVTENSVLIGFKEQEWKSYFNR